MKVNIPFDLAWSNIYEVCYDTYGLTNNQYELGMELGCSNLTTTIHKDDPMLKTFIKWTEKSKYKPRTEEEEAEYLNAYSSLISQIIHDNMLRFNNHEGECVMLPNCYIIYRHAIYMFDVDDEDWHQLRDINDANPFVLQIWKDFCEQENQ